MRRTCLEEQGGASSFLICRGGHHGSDMMRKGLAGQRLVAVFLAGMLLLNYPILSLFDRPERLFGLPLLHVYLFCVWLGLIAAVAWIVERGAR
jgi:hypothetical protein